MQHIWLATLIVASSLHFAAAENHPQSLDSPSLGPRAFARIPRPGRVADDFSPGSGPIPSPPRIGDRPGDRPATSPDDVLGLPKRPGLTSSRDGADGSSSTDRDPYVPPEVPDLSVVPSKDINTGSGEAGGTYHPCSPKRYDGNLCEDLIGVGVDLLGELLPGNDQASDSTTTRKVEPGLETATTVSSVAPTDFRDLAIETSLPAIPNLNMSEWMSGTKYREVYTPEEFELLQNEPVCFFAVQERIYRAYASFKFTSTGAGEEATTSAVQPAPTSEGLSRRQIGCHNAPELCKEPADKARTLYLGYLPDQIHLVYKYTPTEVTVKETGTTSCEGFTMEDQVTIPAFETKFGVFEYREGQSPTPEPTAEPSDTNDNMVQDHAGRGMSLSIVAVVSSALLAMCQVLL